jgi:hypothetical protein
MRRRIASLKAERAAKAQLAVWLDELFARALADLHDDILRDGMLIGRYRRAVHALEFTPDTDEVERVA